MVIPVHRVLSTAVLAHPWESLVRFDVSLSRQATNIFGESDSDADAPKITVNRKFATAYEERKRRQELSKAREMGYVNDDAEEDEEDASTSESEDEGDALTPYRDLEIMRTIKMIRSRDPRVYDPNTKFYESASSTDDSDEEGGDGAC